MNPRACPSRFARATAPSHPRHAAARRARGAAYVEAVILIMFMIIVFGGVQYLANYFNAKQTALGVARRCAWIFSKNACDMKDMPADCVDAVSDPRNRDPKLEEEPNDELYNNIKNWQTAAESPNGTAGQVAANDPPPPASTPEANLRGGVNAQMSGLLAMVVGQSLTAVATEQIRRTPRLAAAQSEVTVSFYMPCNLKHEDPLEVAKDLFFKLLGDGL